MVCGRRQPQQLRANPPSQGACGKTSLLNVFTRGYFPQVYEPTVYVETHGAQAADSQV